MQHLTLSVWALATQKAVHVTNVCSCLFVALAQGLALNLSIIVTGSTQMFVKSRAMAQKQGLALSMLAPATAVQTPVSSFWQHLRSSLPVRLVQGQGAESLVPGNLALHLCGGKQVGG